ncbi:sensor histidine kinase [Sphingobacterium sp. UBA6320]|jgi:two-component system LytT family sensor kinase|uniref:sensor histidine kinase n=1 Tax=Sphingobacterium sp. UBA6320 TaxID=1947510 RepID=UPI0025D4D94E|nr:histidine kinase [Sphingobacterium sp. UBA6320]
MAFKFLNLDMTNRRLLSIVLFFWLISFLYLIIGAVLFSRLSFEGVILIAFSQLLLLVEIVVCLFYIFPKFWRLNKAVPLTASIVLLLLTIVFLRYSFEEVLFVKYLGFKLNPHLDPFYFLYDNFYFSLPGVFIALIVYLVAKSFEVGKKNKALEAGMEQAELNFLKSQLNPHFLYNTLNYMYSIALPLSENLSTAILKLSDTMRYTLAQNKRDLLPLSEEVGFIEDYIALHSMQFYPHFYHTFSIEGAIDKLLFPPLLLAPFVENAIKHGITHVEKQPVNIRLDVTSKTLVFEVSNYINAQFREKGSGIGIANVKRRLEILYPGQHSLNMEKNDLVYRISLMVKL